MKNENFSKKISFALPPNAGKTASQLSSKTITVKAATNSILKEDLKEIDNRIQQCNQIINNDITTIQNANKRLQEFYKARKSANGKIKICNSLIETCSDILANLNTKEKSKERDEKIEETRRMLEKIKGERESQKKAKEDIETRIQEESETIRTAKEDIREKEREMQTLKKAKIEINVFMQREINIGSEH